MLKKAVMSVNTGINQLHL